MLSFLNSIYFWSIQEDIFIKSTDYSVFKYANKKESTDNLNEEVKTKYAEKRNRNLIIPNKRPERLKDKLKEFEDALLQYKIITHTWENDTLQLLLSRGLLVRIKFNNKNIISIQFDKNLMLKIQSELLSDGRIIGNQVVCICKDGRLIGHGGMWKDWMIESGLRRNLSMHNEFLVVWGKNGTEHPQPWSPLAKDHQRANLHLYWVGARGPDLIAYKKTDGEPLKVIVSKIHHKTILVIEQKVSHRGAVSVEVSSLELIGNTLKCSDVTAIPLQTQACCTSLSNNESYLIVGCIDGSLALLDRTRGSSNAIKTSSIPAHIVWHASNAFFTMCNERGQLQYFDIALNTINSQLVNEDYTNNHLDVSGYFNNQRNVENLFWGRAGLIVALEQGPLIFIDFINSPTFLSIVQIYLNNGQIEKAIQLLLSWEFDEAAFRVLERIVTYILRRPLNDISAKQLQDALGSFHSPPIPLAAPIRHKYGLQVKSLTRRFFHQLLRAKMYETAFLLAVDLGHHDLFMDLHYIAVKIGETEMAAAARAQASALLSRCSSEASNCSRSSCSQCSYSSNESESEDSYQEDDSTMNDNYLSTNFNNPVPKTYKPPFVPPIPNIDLPKVKLPTKNINHTPTPPLPNTPPLPISTLSLGIPYTPRFSAPSTFRPTNYLPESRFVPIKPPPRIPIVPPLPIPPPLTANTPVKKPQAKVKFSDTVTAFIVPEVKRPIRLPPPPHVTDPQKELADSLPLCHPNEDYLKDFTPIQREQTESPPPAQQKIKVVHFGVV